eukprot:4689793-Lingulodinium_polyedra.AAC.1
MCIQPNWSAHGARDCAHCEPLRQHTIDLHARLNNISNTTRNETFTMTLRYRRGPQLAQSRAPRANQKQVRAQRGRLCDLRAAATTERRSNHIMAQR